MRCWRRATEEGESSASQSPKKTLSSTRSSIFNITEHHWTGVLCLILLKFMSRRLAKLAVMQLGLRTTARVRTGYHFFMKRHPELTLRRHVNLESACADSMNPENFTKHFARTKAFCEKHGIKEATRIFNLDESGFLIRGMTLGRSKCVVKSGSRGNTREPKFRGTSDHITLMPVVSASGTLFTPLVVLPGVNARFRKRSDVKYKKPADYLPQPHYLRIRSIARVDTDIFYSLAQQFVRETEMLRVNGNKMLLVMDGYAFHVSYRTLSLLHDNGIVVVGLPAHTSHVLQPLEVGVFGPLKEEFWRLLSRRTITAIKDKSNDIFTIRELLFQAYHTSVNAVNVIGDSAALVYGMLLRDVAIRRRSVTNILHLRQSLKNAWSHYQRKGTCSQPSSQAAILCIVSRHSNN